MRHEYELSIYDCGGLLEGLGVELPELKPWEASFRPRSISGNILSNLRFFCFLCFLCFFLSFFFFFSFLWEEVLADADWAAAVGVSIAGFLAGGSQIYFIN